MTTPRNPEYVTEDGYPTEVSLARIREWPWADWRGLMAFVKSIWWMADWGWRESVTAEGRPLYSFSTAGWSGNEDIVEALQANGMCWTLLWKSSRRGGHYEFEPIVTDPAPPTSPRS